MFSKRISAGNQTAALGFSTRVRCPSRRGVWPNLRWARRPGHARSVFAFFFFLSVRTEFLGSPGAGLLSPLPDTRADIAVFCQRRADSLFKMGEITWSRPRAERLTLDSRKRLPRDERLISRNRLRTG